MEPSSRQDPDAADRLRCRKTPRRAGQKYFEPRAIATHQPTQSGVGWRVFHSPDSLAGARLCLVESPPFSGHYCLSTPPWVGPIPGWRTSVFTFDAKVMDQVRILGVKNRTEAPQWRYGSKPLCTTVGPSHH